MLRPATIACQRCDNTVSVRERGPVPAFCAKCRRQRKRASDPRPVSIACRYCGSAVEVRPHGPLPKQCRGECQEPAKQASSRRRDYRTLDVVPPESVRPLQGGANGRPDPAQRQATGPFNAQPERLDVAAEAQRLATPNYELHVRLGRMRRVLSLGLWLLVVLAVVLIFLVGSQPSPQELGTFSR